MKKYLLNNLIFFKKQFYQIVKNNFIYPQLKF